MPTSQSNNQFPTFPEDIIQGPAREFVELYAPIREVLPQALWLSFCTYLGALISPYARLDAESSEPRFFGVVVGRSARTRKSTANNAARDLFRKAFPGERPLRIVEGFGSSEGLLAMLKAQEAGTSTVLHLDEVNVIAQKTCQENTIGIAAFHKLFDGHDVDHHLASKDYKVRGAYLSVVGASTMEDFTTAWSAKHEDAGFLSRLLVVGVDDPPTRKAVPRDPDPQKLEALVRDLRSLHEGLKQRPAVFSLDADAEEVWTNFYNDGIGLEPVWNRIDTYGLRLMTLQTALEGAESVGKETVQRIVEFLSYEAAVRTLLEPSTTKNQAADMERAIHRALLSAGELEHRELQRKTNYHRYGVKVFDQAATCLENDGQIVIERRNGKPVAYRLVEEGPSSDCHHQCHQGDDDTPTGANSNEVRELGSA